MLQLLYSIACRFLCLIALCLCLCFFTSHGADEVGEKVRVSKLREKYWWNSSLVETNTSSRPLKLTFNEPARHWTDAFPIGNGRLGAMVWGNVTTEVLQLNEDTLWTGVPGVYTNSSGPEALAEVRKLVNAGKYPEATDAAIKLSGLPSEVYELLGDIKLEFDRSHAAYAQATYHRELDLDTATVKVQYSVGDVEFTREHFVSHPDQTIVTKISASKPGSLSFTASMDSKLHHHSEVHGKNQIVMQGRCPGKRIAPKVRGQKRSSFQTMPPDLYASSNPKGIQFSAILDLQMSDDRGVVSVLDGRRLRIEGSDWAVLRLVAATSFDGPFTMPKYSKKNPDSESLSSINSIRIMSYSDLYARHLNDYQSLFHRVSLQLSKSSKSSTVGQQWLNKRRWGSSLTAISSEGGDDKVSTPTPERVKSFQTDEDPSFIELLFQYGRYLLISSSRPGTQVANLQGIWNKNIEPAWDGAPHLNINLQMNYWPSLSCNIKECQEPLFDYISSLAVNGRKTAQVNYDTSGWVAHQVSDIWAKTSPDRGLAVWALWPMGGAWLCTHLWEHYTYTLDKDFLENKAYPLLEGCTSFLLDWLIPGKEGGLETNPSTSPEHMFTAPDGKPASVSYSSTMDMSIIKEVFSAIVAASEVLGKSEDAIIKRVIQAQPKLLPTKISKDGSIMEWAEDFEDPDVHHRHVSHLFGLFPGHTINLNSTPDLCKAADFTLNKRGDEGPGWSTAWKIALWARLRNSEHAYRLVKHLISLVDPDNEAAYEGGLYSNLFTAHPPFQIDANFGFSAAVAEMLVQSTMKDLYLLPALPRDKWPNGCAKGLKARGGITVNMCWKDGELHEVGLWSQDHDALVTLNYRETRVSANLSKGTVYTFNKELSCVKAYYLD